MRVEQQKGSLKGETWRVQLRDDDHLWGKATGETRSAIWREIGDPEVKVVSVGTPGENLVKFAHTVSSARKKY